MMIPFKDLPANARLWIYPSNRPFSASELVEIHHKIKEFLSQWMVHGTYLKSGYEIRYRRFIILGVDQNFKAISGCSIDRSVAFIQELEKTYQINLLDKMNVSFRQGEFLVYKPLKEFRKMVKEKAVSRNTIVFNNLVNTKEEYLENWEVPVIDSWHHRFLN